MDWQNIQNKLGYTFRDTVLLETALTHSSYANEGATQHRQSNQRLEFLGDSVLGLVAGEYLYQAEQKSEEGQLTKWRAAVVCEKALCGFAQELRLGDYLLLGRGEAQNGGATRSSILADAFEAITAAIYLDGGLEAARTFLLPWLKRELASQRETKFHDYKTQLQEIVQQNPEEQVEYVLTGEEGPDHHKLFIVEVRLHSNVLGSGRAHSKKEAEQQAAREALKLMGY